MNRPTIGFNLLNDPEWQRRLPANTRRVIIDIALDKAVTVYTESFADDSQFVVGLATLLDGAEIRTAEASGKVEMHHG